MKDAPPWGHATLGNVLDRITTLICTWNTMKICKDLVDFMFHISTVEIGNWSFGSYLKDTL